MPQPPEKLQTTPPKLSELNTEQIRILVAESCGWTDVRIFFGTMQGEPRDFLEGSFNGMRGELPSYTTDLNAMLQAEEAGIYHDGWDSDLASDYLANLILQADTGKAHSATAPQRAKAYLLTRNLATA